MTLREPRLQPVVWNALRPAQAHASENLLASALSGLLGLTALSACSSQGTPQAGRNTAYDAGIPAPRDAGASADAAFNNVLSTTKLSLQDFGGLCEQRGGLVTTSASCAGSNLCRGLSYLIDGSLLTEHSCQGLNSCAGVSCVNLPQDTGLTGKQIYEDGPCAGCHNRAAFDAASEYGVFIRAPSTPSKALAAFKSKSRAQLVTTVGFGTQGVNDDGTTFSNMPAYRRQYSRAELERVVDYLLTLPSVAYDYKPPSP